MTIERFEELFEEVVADLGRRLTLKNAEYARGNDKLHNFKVAARVKGESPERALYGMEMKHRVSIMDMTDDLDRGKLPTKALIDEKFGDEIAYLILWKMLFLERLENEERFWQMGVIEPPAE